MRCISFEWPEQHCIRTGKIRKVISVDRVRSVPQVEVPGGVAPVDLEHNDSRLVRSIILPAIVTDNHFSITTILLPDSYQKLFRIQKKENVNKCCRNNEVCKRVPERGHSEVERVRYLPRDGSLGSGGLSPTMRMATPVTRPTISA
jgi:hypothetical protein